MESRHGQNNQNHLSPIQHSTSLPILYKVSPEWQRVNPCSLIPLSTPSPTLKSTSHDIITTSTTTSKTDVSEFSIKQLRGMCENERKIFGQLNFKKVDIEAINSVFPINKIHGKNDPPIEQRTSAKKIREWRRMGRSQQETIMEKK
eukprot:11620341-Ditylum_brightwellii.AAC.1